MNQGQAMWALEQLLAKAIAGLAGLPQPVVVAACPRKHDDMGNFPNWLGVQAGTAWWELAEYGRHPEVLQEGDQAALEPARRVLDILQHATWRWLTEQALGTYLHDEVLALVIQHDAPWLLVSSSMAGDDAAFLVQAEGDLLRVGKADRLDQRLGHAHPLRLVEIDPTAWPAVRATVPGFPMPTPGTSRDQPRHDRLMVLLADALTAMAALPGRLRRVISAGAWHHTVPLHVEGERFIAIDDVRASGRPGKGRRPYGTGHGWAASAGALQDSMDRLDRVLEELEAAGWRDLFSATVAPVRRDESLSLLVVDDQRWVILDNRVAFTPTPDGGLALAGACCSPGHTERGALLVIHHLDGRRLLVPEPTQKG